MQVRLPIGRQIEMLGAPPPTVQGSDGLRAMQVRDLLMKRIPIAAAQDKDRALRLWNIGLDMDREEGDVFEMSKADCELLRGAVVIPNLEVWARVNLDQAFDEALK